MKKQRMGAHMDIPAWISAIAALVSLIGAAFSFWWKNLSKEATNEAQVARDRAERQATAAEREAQSNVLRFPATSRQENQPDNVVDFPRAQEENLPDFTKLAARKVTNRPEWEKRQALNEIGEESQDPGDYE
ncbi:hypothetical protein [Schaalia turicensis]|uniref:hypothetical protein n=1 Tax=Schaalia turicensis TaxID=131111 RepID=UPI00189BCB1A|nr:hypothetical protein [Schaalia turicensis]